jgi:hypothetical protein
MPKGNQKLSPFRVARHAIARRFAPITGDLSNRLFHKKKWICAFAGMTAAGSAPDAALDFFTRSLVVLLCAGARPWIGGAPSYSRDILNTLGRS